jgi:hypothetical protein
MWENDKTRVEEIDVRLSIGFTDSEQCRTASYCEHGEISAAFSSKSLLVASPLVIKYLSNERQNQYFCDDLPAYLLIYPKRKLIL